MDDLIHYVGHEIAMDGDDGTPVERLDSFVRAFYDAQSASLGDPSTTDNAGGALVQKLDESFLEFVWSQLIQQDQLKVAFLKKLDRPASPALAQGEEPDDADEADNVGDADDTLKNKQKIKAQRKDKGKKDRDARISSEQWQFCELSQEELSTMSRAQLADKYGYNLLRIAADPETSYVALTGSHVRSGKLTHFCYQVLQAISRGRENGKTVVDLGKEFDHDQKSLFHFVKSLVELNLIVKIRVTESRQWTSRCIHRHYLENSAHWATWMTKDPEIGGGGQNADADSDFDEPEQSTVQRLSMLTVAHLNANEPLIRSRILTALRNADDHTIQHSELCFAIGFQSRPAALDRRRLNRIIHGMVQQGQIEKVGVERPGSKGLLGCIRLVDGGADAGHPFAPGHQSEDDEEAQKPNIILTRPAERQVMDILMEAGAQGLTLRELRASLGDINLRTLDVILSRYEKAPLPPHLCDFRGQSVLETEGREKRLRWFSVAGYHERCRLDGLEDLPNKMDFSHPEMAGEYSTLETSGFYRNWAEWEAYANTMRTGSRTYDQGGTAQPSSKFKKQVAQLQKDVAAGLASQEDLDKLIASGPKPKGRPRKHPIKTEDASTSAKAPKSRAKKRKAEDGTPETSEPHPHAPPKRGRPSAKKKAMETLPPGPDSSTAEGATGDVNETEQPRAASGRPRRGRPAGTRADKRKLKMLADEAAAAAMAEATANVIDILTAAADHADGGAPSQALTDLAAADNSAVDLKSKEDGLLHILAQSATAEGEPASQESAAPLVDAPAPKKRGRPRKQPGSASLLQLEAPTDGTVVTPLSVHSLSAIAPGSEQPLPIPDSAKASQDQPSGEIRQVAADEAPQSSASAAQEPPPPRKRGRPRKIRPSDTPAPLADAAGNPEATLETPQVINSEMTSKTVQTQAVEAGRASQTDIALAPAPSAADIETPAVTSQTDALDSSMPEQTNALQSDLSQGDAVKKLGRPVKYPDGGTPASKRKKGDESTPKRPRGRPRKHPRLDRIGEIPSIADETLPTSLPASPIATADAGKHEQLESDRQTDSPGPMPSATDPQEQFQADESNVSSKIGILIDTKPKVTRERLNHTLLRIGNEMLATLQANGGIAEEGRPLMSLWEEHYRQVHGKEPHALDRKTATAILENLEERDIVKRTRIQMSGANNKLVARPIVHLADIAADSPAMKDFITEYQASLLDTTATKGSWLVGRKTVRMTDGADTPNASPAGPRRRGPKVISEGEDARTFFSSEWRIVAQSYGWQFGPLARAATLHQYLVSSITDENDSTYIVSSNRGTRMFASPFVYQDTPMSVYMRIAAPTSFQPELDALLANSDISKITIRDLPAQVSSIFLTGNNRASHRFPQLLEILTTLRLVVPVEQSETPTELVIYSGAERQRRYFRPRAPRGARLWLLLDRAPVYDTGNPDSAEQRLLGELPLTTPEDAGRYWEVVKDITLKRAPSSDVIRPPTVVYPALFQADVTFRHSMRAASRWHSSYVLLSRQKQYLTRESVKWSYDHSMAEDDETVQTLAYKVCAPVEVVRDYLRSLAFQPAGSALKRKRRSAAGVENEESSGGESSAGEDLDQDKAARKKTKLRSRQAATAVLDRLNVFDNIVKRFRAEHPAASEALDKGQEDYLRNWFSEPGSSFTEKSLAQHLQTLTSDTALPASPYEADGARVPSSLQTMPELAHGYFQEDGWHRDNDEDDEAIPVLPPLPAIMPSTTEPKTVTRGWTAPEDDQLKDFFVILMARANHLNTKFSLNPIKRFYPHLTHARVTLERLKRFAAVEGEAKYLDALQEEWEKVWLRDRGKPRLPDPHPTQYDRFNIEWHRSYLCQTVDKEQLREELLSTNQAEADNPKVRLPRLAKQMYSKYVMPPRHKLSQTDSAKHWDYAWSTGKSTHVKENDYNFASFTSPFQAVQRDLTSNERLSLFNDRFSFANQLPERAHREAESLEKQLEQDKSLDWPVILKDGDMLAMITMFSEDLIDVTLDTSVTAELRPRDDYKTRKTVDEAFDNKVRLSIKDVYYERAKPLFTS